MKHPAIKKDHKLDYESALQYKNAVICRIRRGTGAREIYVYAEIRTFGTNGELLVSALLDYCVDRMTAVSVILSNGPKQEPDRIKK